MFAKDIKAGYPEYKTSELVKGVVSVLDSPNTDLLKFIEQFESVKDGADFFYMFWILFFEPIERNALTRDHFINNIEQIKSISSRSLF